MTQKTTTKENLEYQKISAQKFKRNWPQTESITFTQEGRKTGSGQWAANAIVTLSGEKYEEIIGPWMTSGDALPDPAAPPAPTPVTVIYSDDSSEVLP